MMKSPFITMVFGRWYFSTIAFNHFRVKRYVPKIKIDRFVPKTLNTKLKFGCKYVIVKCA